MTPSEEFYKQVKELFNKNNQELELPIYSENINFKKVLEEKLQNYKLFFEEKISPILIDKNITFDQIKVNDILEKITKLNQGIITSVDKYLNGKTYESNTIFIETLNNINLEKISLNADLKEGNIFFRARLKTEIHYSKKDLFHIPFEKRTFVSTNRYSIPGIPALYLGDNSYTCWEEFDRIEFKNLYFSVFENIEPLSVIQILRLEDYLNLIEREVNHKFKSLYILRLFLFFPISIACCIKVVNKKGNFKPEYIISQMLIEYVAQKNDIDGIKFPSTKINYSNLKNIKSYNYVFPIRQSIESGFCPILKNKFSLSEPSSLNIEEMLNNPYSRQNQHGGGIQNNENSQKLSIINNEEKYYFNTSFGKLDKILMGKKREKL